MFVAAFVVVSLLWLLNNALSVNKAMREAQEASDAAFALMPQLDGDSSIPAAANPLAAMPVRSVCF